MFILTIYLIFLATLLSGIAIFIKSKKRNILEKVIVASLPLITLSIILRVLPTIFYAPHNGWNATRLLQSFTMVKGYNPYPLLGEGPAITSFYGPISSLVYLTTTINSSPTSAVLMQVLINILFAIFPVFCLFVLENPKKEARLIKFSFFLTFCLFVLNSDALGNAIFLHVDSIALGLSCGACVAVHFYKDSKNNTLLILSVLLLALSVWTKYVMIPIFGVLFLYLFLTQGVYVALRYSLFFFVSFATLSILLLWNFGHKEIFFNTITALSCSFKQLACNPHICSPLELLEDKFEAFLIFAQELFKENILYLSIITSFFVYKLNGSVWSAKVNLFEKVKVFFKENDWLLWAMVGSSMIPVALSARQKEGGDINHHALVSYFVGIGALLIIKKVFFSDDEPLLIKQVAQISLILMLFTLSLHLFSVPRILLERFQQLNNNPDEIAYRYLKTHPENVYFPERMLGTVMALNKIYHTGEGIYPIVDCVGLQNKEYFLKYIPRNAEFIAFHPLDSRARYMLRFLPEFNQRAEITDLPGWIVYKRNLTPTPLP